VILGGLVTSTFCEFLIHPGLFLAFSGKDAERLVKADQSEQDELHDHFAPQQPVPVPAVAHAAAP
jgi:HME family heavy-metal exporter